MIPDSRSIYRLLVERNIVRMTGALLALSLTASCGFLRKQSVGMFAQSLTNITQSLASQPDPELVRQGTPTFLLLLDGLIASSPDDPGLLLTGAQAYVAYTSAFVPENDLARRAIFYEKARSYGLRVLSRRKGFSSEIGAPQARFDKALEGFSKKDVPALYTTALAWMGWIRSHADSMEAVADLPRVLSLMNRVLKLDESYEYGGAHLFFGVYYSVQPKGFGADPEKSRAHFEQAMKYAGDKYLLPRVLFAQFYARMMFDRELFEKSLKLVIDANLENYPELRLLNQLAKDRAQALMAQADDLF